MNVAHDSDNRQQPRVAIHVPKLYRVADRVLIWPPVARQRFADHGNVRSVRAVALVKDSSSNQRNFQRLEVSVRDDAEVRAAKALFLLEQAKTICGLGNLILRHEQKHSVWKAAIHRQAAGRANFAHAWDLFEPLNQLCKENHLPCLCFGVVPPFPWKRDVHGHNFVYAEPGIHFEHFHQAASEQSRPDHKNQRDRHLRRHDYPANPLAALGTRLSTPAFFEALAQVPGSRACGGERSEAGGDRGGKQ